MIEYIDKEAAIKEVYRFDGYLDDDMEWRLHYALKKLPTADVMEVRHGSWIVKGDAQPISSDKLYGCSLCGDKNRRYYEWQLSNYCPNCGAKMD